MLLELLKDDNKIKNFVFIKDDSADLDQSPKEIRGLLIDLFRLHPELVDENLLLFYLV